jgi:DHA1 family bicyclomycin/chloramphenicol resistance-like MFS transporter
MAGPAILAYVLIADEYPLEQQPAVMGVYNGIFNLAVALAPVIGSYVNLYFDWRGNFVVILVLGILCLMLGYFVIPNRKSDPLISLSLRSYWPLLTSSKLMTYVSSFCLLGVSYWVFVGMAPILYTHSVSFLGFQASSNSPDIRFAISS